MLLLVGDVIPFLRVISSYRQSQVSFISPPKKESSLEQSFGIKLGKI